MTRDAKTGQLRDTGVRFADVAGAPGLVFEMREVVKMLLGDAAYKRVGARPPRVGLWGRFFGGFGAVFGAREVVKMLLGDPAYKRVSARPPRVGGFGACLGDGVVAWGLGRSWKVGGWFSGRVGVPSGSP
jgi:hypothetical protein